jgi:hypothetical protein
MPRKKTVRVPSARKDFDNAVKQQVAKPVQINIKSNFLKFSIFFGGIILTLIVTQIWKLAFPESPVIVKEVTDSMRIIHEYIIPFQDDSLEKTVESKLKNLKLLNDYDQEIEKRKKIIKSGSQNILTPNLVLINDPSIKTKGYMQGDASSFFSLNCPDLNSSTLLDFKFDFFNSAILQDIAFLRLTFNKYQPDDEKYPLHQFFSEYYEIKSTNENFIRIENNFPKGKYEIFIGFALKKDINAEFPTYYGKKFIRVKN